MNFELSLFWCKQKDSKVLCIMENHKEEQTSPFYSHPKESSSSNIQVPQFSNSTSQVSSVGFNNLKKTATNNSQISNVSSSTIKTNALSRLFSKNRSVSNLCQQPVQLSSNELSYNSDNDTATIYSNETKKSAPTNKFRLSKSRMFPNKISATKPDLTIQTNGHHGLKVSKKILSSSLIDDSSSPSARKSTVSSPVSTFHGLFHRSHSISQPMVESQSSSTKDEVTGQQKIGNNSTRTAMSLSSNNSNSYVTDINFARMYNFTDPDYSIDEVDTIGEHLTFLDLHKKLMVPTDQYLQNRMQKHHASELGLGIVGDNDSDSEYLNKYLIDFGKKNARFYSNILNITKPLFLPTQQKHLQNGPSHPYLGCTLEDIANYVKDNYVNDTTSNPGFDSLNSAGNQKAIKTKLKQPKINRGPSFTSLANTENNENFDNYQMREISQDILTFFIKCMVIFQKDFVNYENKTYDLISLKTLENTTKLTAKHIRSWSKISSSWIYFNQKIRYNLLSIFQPLQKYFQEISMQRSNSIQGNFFDIAIENTLLLAFRDIIVIPFLIQRNKSYLELARNRNWEQNPILLESPSKSVELKSSSMEVYESILVNEELILKKNTELLNNLTNCLGVILSTTNCEPGNADGEQHMRNEIFSSSFVWLTKI